MHTSNKYITYEICFKKYSVYLFRQAYTRTFDNLKDSVGLAFQTQFSFPWSGEFQSLHPFSGPSSLAFKILKLDQKLTKYILKGTYDFKCKYLFIV